MTFSKEKFDRVFALHEKTMESAGEVTGDTESADFRFWSDEQIHAHLIRAESIIVATVSNIMRSGNDFFAIAKVVFRTKFGFLSKIRKFPKNLNFHQKSKIFTKNQKFSPEIKNFHQKFKFSSIIEIFFNIYVLPRPIFFVKYSFLLKIEIMVRNLNLVNNFKILILIQILIKKIILQKSLF